MTILQSLLVLGSIGIIAGLLLIFAYSKLKVEEDPRVEKLFGTLPGSNCGACGYASCHEYASALAKGDTAVNICTVGGAGVSASIAAIIGVDHADREITRKAVVRCGVKDRKYRAAYEGLKTCASANLLGGGMACKYGCFGFDDCVDACPGEFDAIHLNKNSLPVVDLDKCTACGLCVKACPRDIIVLKEVINDRIVYVGCCNEQTGKQTREVCDVGCIACKLCEKRAPEGSFTVKDDLAAMVKQNKEIIIEEIKCPTVCIYETHMPAS